MSIVRLLFILLLNSIPFLDFNEHTHNSTDVSGRDFPLCRIENPDYGSLVVVTNYNNTIVFGVKSYNVCIT